MKLLTLVALGGLGYWLWNARQQAIASAAAGSTTAGQLTVIPTPKDARAIATVGNNQLLVDSAGHYYLSQGSSPYVLPVSAANVGSLLAKYL